MVEPSPCKRPRYRGWDQQPTRLPPLSTNLLFNSGVAAINLSGPQDDLTRKTPAVVARVDAAPDDTDTAPARERQPRSLNQADSSPGAFKFSYAIPWRDLWNAQQALPGAMNGFWTHSMYKGPDGKGIKIEYCRSIVESEVVARTLLQEKVLGFDMEWKVRAAPGIKGNISLIQVACEDRVALFHIALHKGTTVEELLAPSLRKIIESPKITKTGVAILNADGKRLKRFMGLAVKGFFELSHLFRLVKYAENQPKLANKGLVALATQVKERLGLPLSKGPVRCSDWTKPLSVEQITYGASDAYAGFMLFHVMNNARMRMRPTPPLPAFAELHQPIRLAEVVLEDEKSDETPSAVDSKSRPLRMEASAVKYPNLPSPKSTLQKPAVGDPPPSKPVYRPPPALKLTLGPTEKRLYSALSALSKRVSFLSKLPPHLVCSEDTLAELSQKRPSTDEELKDCRGGVLFAKLVSQHNVDLLAFVKKYTPREQDVPGEHRAPLATLVNNRLIAANAS